MRMHLRLSAAVFHDAVKIVLRHNKVFLSLLLLPQRAPTASLEAAFGRCDVSVFSALTGIRAPRQCRVQRVVAQRLRLGRRRERHDERTRLILDIITHTWHCYLEESKKQAAPVTLDTDWLTRFLTTKKGADWLDWASESLWTSQTQYARYTFMLQGVYVRNASFSPPHSDLRDYKFRSLDEQPV